MHSNLLLLLSLSLISLALSSPFLPSSSPSLLPRALSSALPLFSLRGGAVHEPSTLDEVDALLAKAQAEGKAVVLDFSATWCGPCKMIAPLYDTLSEEFSSTVVFLKIDVDANPDTAAKYDVSAMPTFVFISGKGEVADRLAGANGDRLREMVADLAME